MWVCWYNWIQANLSKRELNMMCLHIITLFYYVVHDIIHNLIYEYIYGLNSHSIRYVVLMAYDKSNP